MRRGDVIDDRFEVELLAGSGAMGSVYRARDRRTGGRAAIKVLHRPDGRSLSRFRREARALAELEHPAIVGYIGYGKSDCGRAYLALEWLEGHDLEHRLRQGRLDVTQSLALAARLTEALIVAHARGIVHRDIKPSNVVLVDNRIDRAKLVDFGLVQFDHVEWSGTGTGLFVGTMGYMAPEQASGEADVDARADIFSLGCLLYECLTGKKPFDAAGPLALLAKVLLEETPPLRELVPSAPLSLERLVGRMLAKRRDARVPSAAGLLDEIRAIQAKLADRGAAATVPPSSIEAAVAKRERRLTALVVAGDPTSTVRSTVRHKDELPPVGWLDLGRKLEEFQATGYRLANGAFLATLSSFASATDLAAAAARTALEVRSRLPAVPVVTVTGWTELDGMVPVGELIDRATELLERGSTGKGSAPKRRAAIIDETTSRLLGPQFDVRRTAGRHELHGEHENAWPHESGVHQATPFVGRDREQRMMHAMFEECRRERVARALLVTAEPGLGKTRLAHEFVSRVRDAATATVWTARGDVVGAGSPFRLVGQLVRAAAGIREAEAERERRRKLRECVAAGRKDAALERTVAFLGEIIRTPFPDAGIEELRAARDDASIMADQIQLAWESLVSSHCERGPLVLVLDDMHWGDQVTVRLIDAVLRNLRERPVMVLALGRPEVHRAFPDLWAARDQIELRLGALSEKASQKLVRNAIPHAAAHAVAALVDGGDGHPFMLEELVRCAKTGGKGMDVGSATPEAALAMMQSRLERLTPAARRVLRAASIFGQTFWLGALRELLRDAPDLDAIVAGIVDEELVLRQSQSRFEGDHAYAFRHALVREAAYAMLTEDDRVPAHRAAGAWLERSGEVDPLVLAEHYDRGADPEHAARWYERAASDAFAGNDLQGTIARARRGVACGATGETLGRLLLVEADSLQWRGESEAAVKVAARARAHLRRGSREWFVAGRILVIVAWRMGRHDLILETTQEMRACQPEANAQALRLVAMAYATAAVHRELGTMLTEEVDAAALLLPSQPELMGVLDSARVVFSTYAECLESLTRAVDHFERAGDVRNATLTRISLAVGLLDLGQYARAEEMLRRSLLESERLGNPIASGSALFNLGECLWRMHRLADAHEHLTKALVWWRGKEARFFACTAFILALVELEQGRPERALALARRARAVGSKAPGQLSITFGILSRVHLASGDPARALRAARRGMALRATTNPESYEMLLRLAHAEALRAAGLEEARDAIAEARRILLGRADNIRDRKLRSSFLRNIEENARILFLADKWIEGQSRLKRPPKARTRKQMRI